MKDIWYNCGIQAENWELLRGFTKQLQFLKNVSAVLSDVQKTSNKLFFSQINVFSKRKKKKKNTQQHC